MAHLSFKWNAPVDPFHPNVAYRLYENGIMVVKGIAELQFDLLMDGKPDGKYTYYITSFDPYDEDPKYRESPPSNSITVDYVSPKKPIAPSGLEYKLQV